MDLKLHFELTRSDVSRAGAFYCGVRGRVWRAPIVILSLLIGAYGLSGLMMRTASASRFMGMLFLFYAALMVVAPRLNAFFMARRFFSNPVLGRNVQMHITEGGIGVRSEAGTGSQGWETFKSWMESPDALLLVVYNGYFIILPKHGFERAEEVDALREFLRQRLSNK